jgi:hypothetical protein
MHSALVARSYVAVNNTFLTKKEIAEHVPPPAARRNRIPQHLHSITAAVRGAWRAIWHDWMSDSAAYISSLVWQELEHVVRTVWQTMRSRQPACKCAVTAEAALRYGWRH